MLRSEQAGRPYVKTQHNRDLQQRLSRTAGAIEFKHQNISAVLDELGLPIVKGYRPARNYQGAIFAAIDRFLTAQPDVLQPPVRERAGVGESVSLFEAPAPVMGSNSNNRPAELERLVRKFDAAARDARNREVGKAGEELVLLHEISRLNAAGRTDLAKQVRWVSDIDGDGAGYDIRSYSENGSERLIEVKTTIGSLRTPFFLTPNELAVAHERPADYRLFRVYDFSIQPGFFKLRPPLEDSARLTTALWQARFDA